ncbi:hypothetical protein C8R45DRAFT_792310, partial [Mycena sanguinolenta]
KTANRPSQLDAWVKSGRGSKGMGKGVGPPIPSVTVFEVGWWDWWAEIQPSRRAHDESTPENWAWMRHPGPNGVLGFVAMLYWWGKALADGCEQDELWAEAVSDVGWML